MKPLLKRSISYSTLFRFTEAILFTPLMGLVGQVLKGKAVVDSTALIGFFMSPRGLAAAALTAISFLMIRVFEQAGLSVLRAQEYGGPALTPMAAFTYVFKRGIVLLRAAIRFLLVVVALLAPAIFTTALVARRLLSQHDINFYLATRPTEFLMWGGVVAVVLLVTLGVLAWFAVRWRWVVHVVLFEGKAGGAAFQRSAELSRGNRVSIALMWGAIGLLNVALGLLAAWIGRLVLPIGVALFGASIQSLGILFGALIVLQALIGAKILMAGPITEAMIFTRAYFKRSDVKLHGRLDEPKTPDVSSHVRFPWAYAAGVLVFVSIGGVAGGIWGTEALVLDRPVMIIAHRAAMHTVPENSIPSIDQAIKDRADVAEIDVQLSRDGVVVLAHDSDFSRMGGVAKKVSELTWKEIEKIDLGGNVGVPRLEQILLAARDRIQLNIELKHYGPVDGKLEEQVVALIHRYSDVKQVEIQSLEYEALMAVRRFDPQIRIGYLLSVNARDTNKLDVDFLSVQADRVDARFLRKARRAGQSVYVWTVDELAGMERMVNLGVDGLITNQSARAFEFLQSRASMSDEAKALARITSWLAK